MYNPNEPRDAEGKWTDAGSAIQRAASDKQNIKTDKNDHLLAAEKIEEQGGLQPLEIMVNRTEEKISVFHSVTGSHLADINAEDLKVSFIKSGSNDEKIKGIAEKIKTKANAIVLEREVNILKNYPVRNEEQIKVIEQKIKSLK